MNQNLKYKNTSISYTDKGIGDTIVFLHGFLENKKMWHNYATIFSDQFRVITIDLLGHGETESLGYVHTSEDNAAVVLHLLNILAINKATLIGHSMGGYVALAFAELNPEKTTGLVLVNSTAKEDSEERKLNRTRAIRAVNQNFLAFISMSIANLFSEDNRTRLKSEIDLVKQEALKTPLQGIVASLEGMKTRKDRIFILEQATFPILLVLGKKDPVLNYEETIQQIKNTTVQLHTFSDGHMSPIENEDELIAVLSDFFSNTNPIKTSN